MSNPARIAIVGIGGVFPASLTPEQFWANVAGGVDVSREVPPGRWLLDPRAAYDPRVGTTDHVYSTRGCFIEGFRLDPTGLDLDPALLDRLDPVFHLALHAGRQAFEDAKTDRLDRRRVGVVLGNIALPTERASELSRAILGQTFEERLLGTEGVLPAFEPLNRYVAGLPGGVLAKALGLGGGSYTLDAACASSLYAVKLAADELRAGRADAMLAGGLSRPDSLYTQMGFSQLRALSPRGRCSPFDAAADGLVVGEGCGLFVLKRLEDAVRDGDRVYAVIAGIGLSNDVQGSLLAPSSEGQLRAMRAAYAAAGWRPQDVDLIECHATGTPVGDAVEFESLRSLWGNNAARTCVVGAVKSNVGHALTAAGSAGLLKVLLALREGVLPPTANFARPNPRLGYEGGSFRVLSEGRPWERRREGQPRRAAVSAFGFGGINAHVLLEEYLPKSALATIARRPEEGGDPAIAVVGMGAHFGPWDSLGAFQKRVLGGSHEAPDDERHWWGVEESRWYRRQGFDRVRFRGYFLKELKISLERFRIPPRELEEMLPQQLLMLQVAADAVADARFRPDLTPRTGVFIGIGLDLNTTNFHLRWSLAPQADHWQRRLGLVLTDTDRADWVRALRDAAGPPLTANRTMGALGGIVASRIAREFHVGGPSFTISSEETSGLRALQVAVRLLRQGELDQAIVGAVDLAGDVRAVLATHAARAFSASGEIRPLDARGDGSVVGEGAAAVILKRLDDAIRDSDRIYAVIRGTGAATAGGVERGVPGLAAYREALQRAYADAGVRPDDVTYLETHGSGHADEDDLEAAALVEYFGAPAARRPCAVGSVKADVGHAGAAAGLASLVKACLCLYQRVIPPVRNAETLRAELAQSGRRFFLLPKPQHWQHDRGDGPRRAGVSSFSIDGNCHHVVLEEYPLAAAANLEEDPLPPLQVRTEAVGRQAAPASEGRTRTLLVGGKPFRVPALPAAPTPETAVRAAEAFAGHAEMLRPAADPLLQQFVSTQTARAAAHGSHLRLTGNLTQVLASQAALQTSLVTAALADRGRLAIPEQRPFDNGREGRFDRDSCREFAVGSIAKVLGPDYAEADSFPTRVRLPDEPLMLVDRIVSVAGEPRSLTTGRVVTEHDIHPGSWYLDGVRIPTCLAIEAGQADLFLAGYLGIDFRTRGRAVYRLLDAAVTFHRGLPGPGDVIRYDIRIDRFFRQGDTHLFRFNFTGSVDGAPLLTMKDGCAGFFTAEELAAGRGIVQTELQRRPRAGVRPDDWQALVPMAVESYDERQLEALRAGDLAGCFGPHFAGLGLTDPLRLPGGRMRLVHRVPRLDPAGGRYGLGLIRAEADIHPDDWFLTCHFVDDRVMPGTLMYECCLHTLRIFLLRMGWVAEQAGVVCEPVPGVASRLKCRGQVTEATRMVTYEVSVKEIGYRPQPYALADAVMYADGKPIVDIRDMALRISGLSRAAVEDVWRRETGMTRARNASGIFDHARILEFATGSPSKAFGEPYKPFDSGHFIARLPGPPYQFLDRITDIKAQPWQMVAGSEAEAQYDVPPDAWYFAANRQEQMPFAVLQEVALQSCGWLAAYMGSALTSPQSLRFRNLGGSAVQLAPVTADSGTLTTHVRATKVSSSGGMIIQHYDFAVRDVRQAVYRGDTYFGFFTRQALAQQIGLRDAAVYEPDEAEQARGRAMPYPDGPPFPDRRLRMIDQIDILVPDGGPRGLGFIRGRKAVVPDEWFFRAHFYQDPVWPGSLGLESFLQLLKVFAHERWGGGRFETMVAATPHRWLYRGQVIPESREVTVQSVITAVDDGGSRLTADGHLSVDGLVIYQMNDFTLRLRAGRRERPVGP
jgi:acyl transferase domain-containing protein/3-hydroxymyristoyl/3-hydroxydecanoyl-(acyl carrier protein) dehydratase